MEYTHTQSRMQEIEGIPDENSEEEILAAVRKILTAETVTHPDVQPPEPRRRSLLRSAPLAAVAETVSQNDGGLTSRVFGRFAR